MAARKNGELEAAMANLVQAQTAFLARLAETDRQVAENERRRLDIARQMLEMDRRMVETDRANAERFARIEAILMELSRLVSALPEAVRDKIGFKGAAQ